MSALTLSIPRVLLCAALAACAGESQALTTSTLVYEVDVERVRALGWAPPDAREAELVAAAVSKLKRRLPFDDATTVTAFLDTREIHIAFDLAMSADLRERKAAATESLGVLELLLLPTDEQFERMGIDIARERESRDSERIVWLTRRNPVAEPESVPALLPAFFVTCFGAGNFRKVTPRVDALGYPALGFELEGGAADDFHTFTEQHLNMRLAIVVRDEIRSAPTIAEALPGVGMIVGLEDEAEAQALLAELRAREGPLRRVR